MELRLQPKPEVEFPPADKGIVSKKNFFVRKEFEEISEYFFPGHLIRTWKPKAELLYPSVSDESTIQYECDFNRNVQSCFIEDNAEEVYLRSPPPCFVVIGKFGTAVTKLSKEIAAEYGSVLIEVDDVVSQAIRFGSETSKLLDRILRMGVSLTLNFILALMSYVAHTAEARHRGYVLCGLPRSPHLYDMPVEHQLNYIFSWENKPTVFVHVLYEDEDLVRDRTNLRCEYAAGKCITFHPDYDSWNEEEEEEEEEDKNQDKDEIEEETDEVVPLEPDIDIKPSRPWAHIPRDEESQVWSELEIFEIKIKPMIDLIKSRVDPQYFLTVDSRVGCSLEMVKARMSLLQVWKSPIPFPFVTSKEDKHEEEVESESDEESLSVEKSESNEEITQVTEEPPQTAFFTLFTKNTISPKYRWELSHYNYICPVSLRAGELVEGKSQYAVCFMKYIYFLRDEKSMNAFLKNPRPYVLPIRPKPPSRFIILGMPYSGKTTLAKSLASEFSIQYIDANKVLRSDLERKKSIYREFCRQKAERREIIRLTAQAWQDWRMEEEERITLIEEWILYIQSLLHQRIEQFYNSTKDNASDKETEVKEHSPVDSRQGERSEGSAESKRQEEEQLGSDEGSGEKFLQVHGVGIEIASPYDRERTPVDSITTPSAKIIQALKHEDYDFNENSLEVEANLFFSSLWNSFVGEKQSQTSPKKMHSKFEEEGEVEGEREEEGEGEFEGEMYRTYRLESKEEDPPVNWCSMLPPQSLSSFLLRKKGFTTRDRRRSFQILLAAASKAYWEPSALKSEFVKWRLPCFMDIPLCEIFYENPLLLFRYCPEWLKERPLIPEPVDPMHPSVVEAGRKAYVRADIVKVHHKKEEIGILIRDAIEKAERDGMRVTGEVITPGGWVLDNMVLDLDIWCALYRDGAVANYVYFLMDSDPRLCRIINHWYGLCHQSLTSIEESDKSVSEDSLSEEQRDSVTRESMKEIHEITKSDDESSEEKTPKLSSEIYLQQILKDIVLFIKEGDRELDELYHVIVNGVKDLSFQLSRFLMDIFTHGLLQALMSKTDIKQESFSEETTIGVQSFSKPNTFLSNNQSQNHYPLGIQLQIFTDKIIKFWNGQPQRQESRMTLKEPCKDELQFFILLLSLPQKLERIKDWLNSIGRGDSIKEIDIANKTTIKVFFEVWKDLNSPFIKKPRELESFELEEIRREFDREQTNQYESEFEGESSGDFEESEDVRIFGESGQLCIVNLERNILLPGKIENMMRYYGKLYMFWNEEAKQKFIEDPEKYAPYYSPIRCLPPLRVFLVGPIGTGKTTIAKLISNQCSVHFINHFEFLSKTLIPHLKPGCAKLTALNEKKLLLSDDSNESAKLIKELFMSAPFVKRQFWMENPFHNELVKDRAKLRKNLIPETIDPTPSEFPELEYRCIESAEEEFSMESDATLTSSMTETEEEEEDDDDEDDKVAEEAPFVSMKDTEALLNDYIRSQVGLSEDCVNKSLGKLWNLNPYITQGFVLEGFPGRHTDVEIMLKNNWIPDLVIEISLAEDMVVERNIEKLMDEWNTKLQQEIVEERLLEDTLSTIHKIFLYLKRCDLEDELRNSALRKRINEKIPGEDFGETSEDEKEKAKVKGSFETFTEARDSRNNSKDLSLGSNVDFKMETDIEGMAKEEFPPLVFSPVFETYDAGRARMLEDLVTNYRRDVEEIRKIKVSLREYNIPWHMVDGTTNPKETMTDLFIKLNVMKKRLNQKGEFAFSMSMETAEKLLLQGFYFLSKFGRWCPVQVYRMKNPIHMFRPLSSRGKVIPIAYRNYIYFVGGENEKKHFIDDPIKYTFNEPHHPIIPLRVAVIGPPKTGKSTLSSRLGLMFGLKVVTMGSAIRFVLEKMPQSSLRRTINDYLKRGCFLPLSLKIEAVLACLNDPACVTQGFVFDGIPFDAATAQSLAEEGKLPFVIISLVQKSDFGKANREKLDLTQFRLPYKQRVNLDTRYREWDETYKKFVQWNQDTYNNLYEINAKLSVVDIFYEAYDIIKKSFFAILYYVEYCVTSKALPLQYLCVSQHEYELRKSCYHNNCPVCWFEHQRLSSSTDPPPRTGLVQYLDHFYWICPEHMEKFLKKPKTYFKPTIPEFPKILPKMLNRSMFETASPQLKIHGYGRCPVTRTDFPDSLDWEGSWDYAVSYADEVYLCKNQEMLDRFLSEPWRYQYADTEFEVNREEKSYAVEKLGPPKVTSLPPIGFLEQTVANLIHKALRVLGVVRPVYPDLTPKCTACIFVALYLKVYNDKNQTGYLEKKYLDFMFVNCKAYTYKVPLSRFKEEGQGDVNLNALSDDSSLGTSDDDDRHSYSTGGMQSPMNLEIGSADSVWLDLDAQADKKMWSAGKVSSKDFAMEINSIGNLTEIPELPKVHVVLRYQTYILRPLPLPPVANCLAVIYSCKPNLKLPRKFNINWLYQPESSIVSPFPTTVNFNPEKKVTAKLYGEISPKGPSEPNILRGKRTISESELASEAELAQIEPIDPDLQYLIDNYIPRFQLLDKLVPGYKNPIPKVLEIEPIIFNPHRDYAYTLLLADFFQTSHVLRCYEWDNCRHQHEYLSMYDRNLGLCNVRSRFLFEPKISPSMKTIVSTSTYQMELQAAGIYFPHDSIQDLQVDDGKDSEGSSTTSVANFVQSIIHEKLKELFSQVSLSELSYDSYEISLFVAESEIPVKPKIILREILPYPPLIWDITSRPYYAYRSLISIYEVPILDNIAHQRHVSLLDGIMDTNTLFKFVRYPSWIRPSQFFFVQNKWNPEVHPKPKSCRKPSTDSNKRKYFVFDYFNLHWTSFLTYPISWAYNTDLSKKFLDDLCDSTEKLQKPDCDTN